MLVTGPNGNAIYLPSAGEKDDEGSANSPYYYGGYWSADYVPARSAGILYFYNRAKKLSFELSNDYVYTGKSVRPVFGDYIHVKGIVIDSNITMSVGDTYQIKASITPFNAFDKAIIWSSSDVDVASVDNNGLVIARSEGNTIITATTNDGNYSCTCYVKVY